MKKKQAKIITIHFGTNHGSVLQAYALSNHLQSIGFDAQIIDYVPKRYKMWNSLYIGKKDKYPMLAILAYYPLYILKIVRIRKIFEHFLKRNLNITKRYSETEELSKNPPKADVYISGSDQVWNDDYNEKNDFSYFLEFAPSQAKRIAYAASFGKKSLSQQDYIDNIKPLLERFDAISVRELDGQNILKEMEISSTHVTDPVFLLSREQWKAFANPVDAKKPYTLVYVMDGLYTELLDYAQKLKEKTGNEIYVVAFKKIKNSQIDKCFHLANPKDFVGLVQNADAVITNSFHGTAFSVLFQKKFITVGKTKYNSRMESLLGKLSLTDHYVTTGAELSAEKVYAMCQRNDIDNVDEILQEWINDSKSFIEKAVETNDIL